MARRQTFGTIVPVGPPSNRLYAIRWYEGEIRKQLGGFGTKAKAAKALAEIQVGLGDGTIATRRKGTILFTEVGDTFMRLHAKGDCDESRYRIHVKPWFEGKSLKAITPLEIFEFKTRLLETTYVVRRRDKTGEVQDVVQPIAHRTINLILALVRRILNFAVNEEHIPASPLARIRRGQLMIKIEVQQIAPPIEHSEDVGRMLEEIRQLDVEEPERSPLYGFFSVLVYLGLRRGEAAGLRWTDISFHTGKLTVRKSYEGPTKGRKHRTLGMPPELIPILQAHFEACPWKGELVFPDIEGKIYTENTKLEWTFFAAMRRCGLPRIRVHDLRHVFACTHLENGGDLYTLQILMGHSSFKTTSDYGHLSKRYLAGEANRISYAPKPQAKVMDFRAGAGEVSPASTQIVRDVQNLVPLKRRGNSEKP